MFGEKRQYIVKQKFNGYRVDLFLAEIEEDLSRQYFQKLIKEQKVFIGGKYLKQSYKVKEGEKLIVDYPLPVKLELEPVNLPLDIIYEDEFLLVINKSVGVVVHPAEHGKFMGQSLINAVLFHVGDRLKGIGGVLRPGIVHRLDKDTSGLIIVAKTDLTHQRLVEMFKKREVHKRYMALVYGGFDQEVGRIEGSIGRDSVHRKRMCIDGINAKEAITEFRVLEEFVHKIGKFSLLDINLLTGRTHQIRVHFQSIKHPLVGDQVYGSKKINDFFMDNFGFDRQFLHAYKLEFNHPITKKELILEIKLAPDLQNVLDKLS